MIYLCFFRGRSQRGNNSVYFYHCLTVSPRVSHRTLFSVLNLKDSFFHLLSTLCCRAHYPGALCVVALLPCIALAWKKKKPKHLNLNCWGVYGGCHSGVLMKVSSSFFMVLRGKKSHGRGQRKSSYFELRSISNTRCWRDENEWQNRRGSVRTSMAGYSKQRNKKSSITVEFPL